MWRKQRVDGTEYTKLYPCVIPAQPVDDGVIICLMLLLLWRWQACKISPGTMLGCVSRSAFLPFNSRGCWEAFFGSFLTSQEQCVCANASAMSKYICNYLKCSYSLRDLSRHDALLPQGVIFICPVLKGYKERFSCFSLIFWQVETKVYIKYNYDVYIQK